MERWRGTNGGINRKRGREMVREEGGEELPLKQGNGHGEGILDVHPMDIGPKDGGRERKEGERNIMREMGHCCLR